MTTQTVAGSGPDEALRVDSGPGEAAARGVSRLDRTRDVLITIVGSAGMIAIAWLVATWLFGLSLIVFVTGSMAPTMSAGSVAISQTTPAAALSVGDVVTVPRPDTGQPVTHRIVGIESAPAGEGFRELSLQGDDNAVVDSHRYVVDEAPRVVFAIPHVGTVVLWAQTPPATVGGSILIAATISWALWPTGSRRPGGGSTEG